jgi:hypothetical protein
MSIPTPKLYLPLTSQPTDNLLGLTTSTTAPSYDSNNGAEFNDMLKSTSLGSEKFISIPISTGPNPIVQQSGSMTVCFCMNINNHFPNWGIHLLSQGRKSAIGAETNAESIDIYYNQGRQIYMSVRLGNNVVPNNGNTLETPVGTSNPVRLNSNTWYFVAYTIEATGSALKLSLYVGNRSSMVRAKSAGVQATTGQDNIGYNKDYKKSNSNTNIPNTYYDQIQLGDRFHHTNNTNNTGFGLNGYIRDFMVFDSVLTLAQLTTMAKTLPEPGTAFPVITIPRSFPAIITMPTIDPQFSLISNLQITELQELINYIPRANIFLPLTIQPTSPTATVNSDTTIEFTETKGASFPNNSSPELTGITTNNYINIPVTSSKILTILFPIYLNYINTNSLRILTFGNVSESSFTEVLSINSNKEEGYGDPTMSIMDCSTNPRHYGISTTIYNTAENQNTVINQNVPSPPPSSPPSSPPSQSLPSLTYVSSVNGYNANGNLQNNNSTSELINSGLSQFPANNVVTITGYNNDIFVNSNDYIGSDISGPFISTPSTIVSIVPLGRISNSSSGADLYNFTISNPFTEYPINLEGGNIYQYLIGPKPTTSESTTSQSTTSESTPPAPIASISSVNGYDKRGNLQTNNTNDELTNSGLSQFPANNVVTVTSDDSDIFVNSNNYIGNPISGPFITTPSTILDITPLGNVSRSSSGKDLYNFTISNPFTGYPINLEGGNIYEYSIGPKPTTPEGFTEVFSPGIYTETVSGTTITTVYTGYEHALIECTWTLLTLVLDGTNITMYMDGTAFTSVPIPTNFTYNTIRIGDSFNNNNLCFIGSIKNFMIYNTALNLTNQEYLYNKYIPNTTTESFALHFNQNNIPLLEDTTETFVNIHFGNNFVKYAKLYSIVGILFYAILLLTNANYQHIIPNKNVSFALNVLLIICVIISIRS